MGVSQFIYDEKCFYQGKMMVEQASAQRCAGRNYYRVEDCDHFTICKPVDKSHGSYPLLVGFIKQCQQEVSSIDSMDPFVAFLFITNLLTCLIS
jgi:hypothetical protein